MTTVWSSLQYGWSHVYWLTIEGIPVYWAEKSLGLSLPAAYTSENPLLVIDDSSAIGAEVGPRGGLGKSLPLSFRLRDGIDTRTYLKRWSNEARLTADITSSVTTITVDSTTGFASSGSIWIGVELITYTGTTATTFTGCTRGVAGKAYPHRYGNVSGLVTDAPRWWKGRDVTLYASPMDPTGYAPGSAWTDNASVIWRGHISSGPRREGLHFAFDALSIDRRLAMPIGRRFSGRLTDTEERFAISKDDTYRVAIQIRNGANVATFDQTVVFVPFANDADGDLLTGTQIRARMTSAYETAVSAGGWTGTLDSLIWKKAGFKGVTDPALSQVIWTAHLSFDTDANARSYTVEVYNDARAQVGNPYTGIVAQLTSGQAEPTFWTTTSNPFRHTAQGAPPFKQSATVVLTEGDPADAPTTGVLRVGDETFHYAKSATGNGFVYLSWLTKLDAKGYGSLKPGAECAILASDGALAAPNDVAATVRKMIHSSGEGGLRDATWDSLSELQGYGIDNGATDASVMGQILYGGMLGQVRVQVVPDDESLEDMFGGLLELSGRAIVARPNASGDVALTAIDVGEQADYATTIADTDLLTVGADPVRMERIEDWPNRVEVSIGVAGQESLRLVFADRPAIAAQGGTTLEVKIPAIKPESMMPAVQAWVMSILQGSQTAQLMRCMVGPWCEVECGDGVQVNITHPAIWDWSTGQPGYTGPAVCIGRHTTLKNGQTELLLLVKGGVNKGALCPSAGVLATDNTTAPTYIDVPGKYLAHFTNAIAAAGGNIRVLHYRPGQAEGVSEGYNISAAADNSGNCRLTVASLVGTPTLTANNPVETDSSHLTLPESANDDAYQARFMHDADGSKFA